MIDDRKGMSRAALGLLMAMAPGLEAPIPDLLRSYNRTTCPRCGDAKKSHKTFCGRCSHQLPRDLRQALYTNGVNAAYAKAVAMAMAALGATKYIMPPAGKS